MQQRQRIQRPGGMVGDDQQPAMRGNAPTRLRRHLVAQLQEIHGCVDEGEITQVCVLGQEAVRLVQSRPAPKRAQQRSCQRGPAATEPVRIAFGDLLFQRAHDRSGKASAVFAA
jgi:hypothetical protein